VKETLELKNPLKGKSRTVIALIIIGLILLFVGVASAVIYKLSQSNPAVITVNDTISYLPVNLTPATATINEGEQVLLTASAGVNAAGKTAHFMEGATEIGTDTFDSSGVATLLITPSPGVHTYYTAAEP